MAGSPGMAAVGVGGIGFGVLLMWSAYTKKPLFGPDGAIRAVIGSGSINGVGKAVGSAAGKAAKTGADVVGGGTDRILPIPSNTFHDYDMPPGAEGGIWA